MKKSMSLLLVLVLCIGLFAGCGSKENPDNTPTAAPQGQGTGEQVVDDGLPPMTKDEITLTYFNFDSEVVTTLLAEKFEEKYPNINVEIIFSTADVAGDTLLSLIGAGNTPDCFMYTDSDFALSNDLLYDMTELWEADKSNKNLLSTINDTKIGYYQTDKKYATPIKFFPGIIYVDMNVIEELNLDMPRADWTWGEMIQLIKDATDKTQSPAYYGLGVYNRLDSYYGIAASQDIVGEFGFDGEKFDLSVWAVGEQEFADLKLNGYVAPNTETQRMENWLGDWDGWAGASGRVAIMSEAYWTYMNLFDTEAYRNEIGVKFVPYVIPSVEEVDGVAHTIATMDMGGISKSTKYPREAYELLKWMGWGVDGWNARLDLYEDQSITNAAGLPLIRDSIPAPITLDENVWKRYRALYPTNEEEGPYWDAYFESCTAPIPFGWMNIAGYWTFCDEYFNSIGIHDLVDGGTAKASDYQDEATEMANYYHAQAMYTYFGIKLDGYTPEQ